MMFVRRLMSESTYIGLKTSYLYCSYHAKSLFTGSSMYVILTFPPETPDHASVEFSLGLQTRYPRL